MLDSDLTLDDDVVVVVGFGPVGAVAALALAQAGFQVLVLEADPVIRTDPADSRASTFHPPSLEMLDELDVLDELLNTGLVADTYQMRDRREGLVASFDLALLAGDTRYPFRLQNEQQNLVSIIARRLASYPNVEVILDARVSGVAVTETRVQLTIGPADDPRTVTASWVIAADGADSAIRRGLDVEFAGMTYPERFLVVSTTQPFDELIPGIAFVNYVTDAERWLVLLRTPRHWRALFPVSGEAEPGDLTDLLAVQQRLQRVAALEPGYAISHVTLYNVHQRVASDFRRGPILLVGDAAHINNPLGGMGMNSGIHDAMAAVEAVQHEQAGEAAALDRYATQRRTMALEFVQTASHRNWEQLQERDETVRAYARRTCARSPPIRSRPGSTCWSARCWPVGRRDRDGHGNAGRASRRTSTAAAPRTRTRTAESR